MVGLLMATLTPAAEQTAESLAQQTGLDLNVIRAWIAHESAWGRSPSGAYNFLNLKNARGGWAEFASPSAAAAAYAAQLRRAPGWYGGILHSAGASPQEQISAIAASPWDEGHYGGRGGPNLAATYRSVTAAYGGAGGGVPQTSPDTQSPPAAVPSDGVAGTAQPAAFGLPSGGDLMNAAIWVTFTGAALWLGVSLIKQGVGFTFSVPKATQTTEGANQ